jgi:murein DD-endopeptidase MepM/ murein hydrolase activator NlpD
VPGLEIEELVSALKGVFDFRRSRAGDVFELRRDAGGRLSWFRYASSPTTIAVAFRGSDGVMKGLAEPVHVVTETVLVDGRVTQSLYEAMDAAGEGPMLTLAFVDLFAWDVDFFTETQAGDQFRILVEKKYVDGRLVGYGRLIGAEYFSVESGKIHRAFLYEREDGSHGYYTETGDSVRKSFLKSPIQFASITSRYGMRRHPILRYVRAHRGVDYGAPLGTAVWAVGDGVVGQAGWSGGYGNLVVIRHSNGLETRYAHLRGFASGVRSGARVSQKQIIGYVGKTGLATGPHLHFEVLRNGRYANPLSVAVPPAPPIPDAERARFSSQIAGAVEKITEAHRRGVAAAAL